MDSFSQKPLDFASFLETYLEDVQPVAQGGMSVIFRAFQKNLGRTIAVKRLKDELKSNPEIVERFRREARALASVLHQNIACVFDFIDDIEHPHILMEYIEGVDLSTIIQKLGQLPQDIAIAIGLGVSKGLQHIHSRSLIHRDIKPSNIRITPRGVVKLMDFGIVLDTEEEHLTRPGVLIGSPQYLSPEQVVGDPLTAKSDQFLFGICLYEMVTGVKPFRADSSETVYQKIRSGNFIAPRKLNPSLDPMLDKLIRRCLSMKPQDRYRSMNHVSRELEGILGSEKSHHTESMIVSYLAREALIDSPMVSPQFEKTQTSPTLKFRSAVGLLVAVMLFFSLGFFLAKHMESKPSVAESGGYEAPRKIR